MSQNTFVTIYGPALDDPKIIVSRQCKESEVPAWRAAGYTKGVLSEEYRDASKAYWLKKAKDLDAELASMEKKAKDAK